MTGRCAFLSAALAAALVFGFVPKASAAGKAALTGVELPPDYRVWVVAAPSLRTDKNLIRTMVVNPTMAEAYRKGTYPFPEGSTIVKISHNAIKSPTWDAAVVPGDLAGVEVMVKDSKRYASEGGWGFGRFSPTGEPIGTAEDYKTCFPCHVSGATEKLDYIFTRWAP